MRGTKSITHGSSTDPRITPACAGNSRLAFPGHPPPWDHPRVCGEQIYRRIKMCNHEGSPPRVRGTVCEKLDVENTSRITPACAGNSLCRTMSFYRKQDHPRVCGEQAAYPGRRKHHGGSPPRVRGTAAHCPNRNDRARITPACAGNSAVLPDGLLPAGDHPRVCGEQFLLLGLCLLGEGSPPRVRGTVQGHVQHHYIDGITPACAGNRENCPWLIRPRWDHPRVCGEQRLGRTSIEA